MTTTAHGMAGVTFRFVARRAVQTTWATSVATRATSENPMTAPARRPTGELVKTGEAWRTFGWKRPPDILGDIRRPVTGRGWSDTPRPVQALIARQRGLDRLSPVLGLSQGLVCEPA